jgi:hypothetical protein
MAISEVIAPATKMLGGGIGGIMKYAWVLFPIVIIIAIVGVIWVVKSIKKKKLQWTHKLKVRRVLQNNILSEPVYMLMRRFPLIKRAEVFELEKPLLGGYLIPELDQYSGDNEFSIILDKNNRIYTNQGEFFDPAKSTVNVSAKHSEIDIERSNLKADFQNINQISKRIEWATIAKYALIFVALIVGMVIVLTGLSKWGDAQKYKAESDKAQASAMQNLADAMITIQATVNTQKLEILPIMKEIYKNQNLQGIINTPQRLTNGTS